MMLKRGLLAACALLLACAPLRLVLAETPGPVPEKVVPILTPVIAPVAVATPQPPVPGPAPVLKPARIPFKQDKGDTGALASQSLAALVLAGLAAYGIVLLLKKQAAKGRGPLRMGRRISIVESVRLSRRSTLHIVNYQGEELLFAESEHGLNLVKSTALPTEQGSKNV